jgi:hypothetical protein
MNIPAVSRSMIGSISDWPINFEKTQSGRRIEGNPTAAGEHRLFNIPEKTFWGLAAQLNELHVPV